MTYGVMELLKVLADCFQKVRFPCAGCSVNDGRSRVFCACYDGSEVGILFRRQT